MQRALRVAWPLFAALAVALIAAAIPSYVDSMVTPMVRGELATWHLTPTGYVAAVLAEAAAPALAYLVVALVVYLRARHEPMALFCAFALVAFGAGVIGPGAATQTALVRPAAVLFAAGQVMLGGFLLVFPSGRFVPRSMRWVLLAAGLLAVAVLAPDEIAGTSPVDGPVQAIGVLLLAAGVAVQVYRYRRVSTVVERAQTRWVVFGGVASAVVFAVSRASVLALPPALRDSHIGAALLGGGSVDLALTLIPVFIGVAILRARLWDIDHVINRALLYAALTVAVIAIYVVVVGYLGALLHTETSLWMSLVATGVVAVALQPLRTWLQRGINRLTYGLRDEPYALVAELGRRLEAHTGEALTPAAVTLARALKLPYVAVVDRDEQTLARHGEPVATPVTIPLTPAGRLELGPRRPGEPLTPADQRLLADIARQVGAVAHAVTLAADLQRSRERLVLAREEERRRLRRDLHDGLGPALAGLALRASLISDAAARDPAEAGALGEELYAGIRATIGDIRRLVYDLRPPALDEFGLVGALRQAAAGQQRPGGLDIVIDAFDDLPALPAAVEVAAYRIATEALTNVARHSGARTCRVTVRCADSLEVGVLDDGAGIPDNAVAGVGLVGMRERTAELGGTLTISRPVQGGTSVVARLPLPVTAVPEARRGDADPGSR